MRQGLRICILTVLFLLATAAADATGLDVSIAVFDPGVPEDQSLHRDLEVFPRIREIEAMLLPFVLRETLQDRGDWGAVRVVPQAEDGAELQLSASIVQSDGEYLAIAVRAVDASGRVWLDRQFAGGLAQGSGGRAFQPVYDELAAALAGMLEGFDAKARRRIREISLLRYASQLAPSAFGDYLEQDSEGRFTLRRLPASDDPMLDRIERIRATEYVITDTVDSKFQELHDDLLGTYELWREYRRKTEQYKADNAAHASDNRSDAPRGSFEAMKNLYDNYKWDRLTVQEQDALAVAFDNEVRPTVQAMEQRVAELQEWVDRKYAEWRILLEALFEVETGLGSD